MFIFRIMHAVPFSNQEIVKDVIASLHSYFTCNLLIGLAILLSYKQFGGKPIECMTPLSFPPSWNEYVENYCFSSNTYYVSFNEQIEDLTYAERRSAHISYYQWMPFFLLFQCACFKLPTFIWKYFASQSGVKVGEVLRLATNESNTDSQQRAMNIYSLCKHLQGALRFYDRLKNHNVTPHKFFIFLNVKYSKHYITSIYFISKFAFLLNVIFQFTLLNKYLFPENSDMLAFKIWNNLLRGNMTWKESGYFPRVTLCDFDVREMGQTQNHTIQCVLLLNIFTEKIFLVLWTWYFILAAITFCNFSSWIFCLLCSTSSENFIFNHLELSGEDAFKNDDSDDIQTQISRFISKYLKQDGILILRLIAQHGDVVFTTDLIYRLWESHYFIEKQREALKETEMNWQNHLRRLEIFDENENEKDVAKPKLSIGSFKQSPAHSAIKKKFSYQYTSPKNKSSIVVNKPRLFKRSYSTGSLIETNNYSLDSSLESLDG